MTRWLFAILIALTPLGVAGLGGQIHSVRGAVSGQPQPSALVFRDLGRDVMPPITVGVAEDGTFALELPAGEFGLAFHPPCSRPSALYWTELPTDVRIHAQLRHGSLEAEGGAAASLTYVNSHVPSFRWGGTHSSSGAIDVQSFGSRVVASSPVSATWVNTSSLPTAPGFSDALRLVIPTIPARTLFPGWSGPVTVPMPVPGAQPALPTPQPSPSPAPRPPVPPPSPVPSPRPPPPPPPPPPKGVVLASHVRCP